MRLRPTLTVGLASTLLLALCGCKTSYEGRYRFSPSPAEVVVQPDDAVLPVGRALVSMRGVIDPDKKRGRPLSMGVRVRLENLCDEVIELDQSEFLLVDGELIEFLPPLVANPPASEGDLVVNPGDTGTFDLLFPFPAGTKPYDFDLTGVHFRWVLAWGERTATVGTTFALLLPVDPWPAYGYGVYVRSYCY